MSRELIQRLTGETPSRVAELVESFGGAAPILSADPHRLRSEGLSEAAIEAIGTVRAAAVCLLEGKLSERPLLGSWAALTDYLRADMAWRSVECVRVLYLNTKNHLIANEETGRGSVDEAPVYVREIVRRALELGATALILVHNHPSGDPTPSRQDIRITNELVEAGRHLKLTVRDHVIVAASGHASLRAAGHITH